MKPEHDKPSQLKRACNLAAAVVRHAMDGGRLVSDEDRRVRLEICESCDRRQSEDNTCLECGCYLSVKAGWRSENCPLWKWPDPTGPGTKGAAAPEGQPPVVAGRCGGCGSK